MRIVAWSVCLTLLQIVSIAKCAPAWGRPNGIGIAVEAKAAALHISFRNDSVAPISVVVGAVTGVGPIYNVDLFARTCKLIDTTVGSVGGNIAPVVLRLSPGATEGITIELNRLICPTKTGDITLDKMLQQGTAVHAEFTGTAESNAWARIPRGWIGKVTSGSFVLTAPSATSPDRSVAPVSPDPDAPTPAGSASGQALPRHFRIRVGRTS